MSHTRKARTQRKSKKSYTLSPQSIAFLEAMRKKRHTSSTSLVLEEILQAFRRGQEKMEVDKAVVDYYESLSNDETEEQARWAQFALAEFPKE